MNKKNIALIGMPGCGKSTVGKLLAEKLNYPLADIDQLIEAAAKKSIPQIFAEDGEEIFRKLETHALSGQAAKTGTVIAAGGGIVTRTENLPLLKQNSIIIYLKRRLEELETKNRPLSGSVGIETLAKQRLPLYEMWSDYTVDVEENPGKTVNRILEKIEISGSREK